MKKETTKKWLRQVTFTDVELESKAKELTFICNLRVGLMYASESIREIVENIIVKLNNEIEMLLRRRNKITDTIAKVESQEMKVVLEQRYIHDESISTIAKRINYSPRQTKRLMESAIDEVIESREEEQ
ncbi:MAG: hypothetical protein FWE22_00725 [Firmicutes bacterium]|nr:hypothetical protein [Bacillota bacterium]